MVPPRSATSRRTRARDKNAPRRQAEAREHPRDTSTVPHVVVRLQGDTVSTLVALPSGQPETCVSTVPDAVSSENLCR